MGKYWVIKGHRGEQMEFVQWEGLYICETGRMAFYSKAMVYLSAHK